MADNDNIHEDIREIRGMMTTLVASSAANGAKLEALDTRLFAAASGALPAMWGEIKSAKECASTAAKDVEKVNSKVNNQRAYVAGFSACGIILGGFFKAMLSKMGLNF